MTRRHEVENRFCGTCNATIKHSVNTTRTVFVCLRCGSIKSRTHSVRANDFSHKLNPLEGL